MKILGLLGSPRLNGKCSKLLKKALEGAENKGAETKRYDLIKCNIMHCRGCFKCMFDNPELPFGRCPLRDDMTSILEEYVGADGYIFAAPVYEGFVPALMKKFLERKIALGFREKEAYGKIAAARVPANFKKRASFIVTANCADEYIEVMGDPAFEAMEGHLIVEQIPTTERFYVGGVENMSDETFSEKLSAAYQLGIRLVEEISKAQRS
ncbi:MAG: flavodoxin family protein [Deltaproteobacteria bacterium]|nr:flavodoxin family protein [Deltaproteobacteria bacterium]MCK5421919.1 flavodoxin family protein [Deltaproteobacteria bacterium]